MKTKRVRYCSLFSTKIIIKSSRTDVKPCRRRLELQSSGLCSLHTPGLAFTSAMPLPAEGDRQWQWQEQGLGHCSGIAGSCGQRLWHHMGITPDHANTTFSRRHAETLLTRAFDTRAVFAQGQHQQNNLADPLLPGAWQHKSPREQQQQPISPSPHRLQTTDPSSVLHTHYLPPSCSGPARELCGTSDHGSIIAPTPSSPSLPDPSPVSPREWLHPWGPSTLP